jgi:hypothetical protein
LANEPKRPFFGDLCSHFASLLGHIFFFRFAFFLPYGTARWNLSVTHIYQKGKPAFLPILPNGEKGRKKGR